MLGKITLIDFIKRIDNDEVLEKSEIDLITDSFKSKLINNLKKNKRHNKLKFEKIIPDEEYSILLKIEELDFDINELLMSILFENKYQLYVCDDSQAEGNLIIKV